VTKDIVIREFTFADADKVSALIRNTLLISNGPDYDYKVIRNLDATFMPDKLKALSLRREIFVYERDGQICGTISLENNTIFSFFVAPDKQKEGVGTQLLDFVEDLALQRGTRRLYMAASATAVSFYRKRGYEITGSGGDSTFGRTYNMRKDLFSRRGRP
jgi:GNAT superfamily N-acetyltransferase